MARAVKASGGAGSKAELGPPAIRGFPRGNVPAFRKLGDHFRLFSADVSLYIQCSSSKAGMEHICRCCFSFQGSFKATGEMTGFQASCSWAGEVDAFSSQPQHLLLVRSGSQVAITEVVQKCADGVGAAGTNDLPPKAHEEL